ncbi:hypothetical protein BVX93_01855 [bacterium B13(2017)]|nr:hypothetical protein BVX93_01855 [bacterium B13(2017)]
MKKAIIHFILLLYIILGIYNTALAEEDDLKELGLEYLLMMEMPSAKSVSFFQIDRKNAPGYSHVINSEKLDSLPVYSIWQYISQYVPGVLGVGHVGQGPYLGHRGLLPDLGAKTIFLLDGVNLNQKYVRGYAQPTAIPFLGFIDTLEIINGPGAILHGSGAINGFINISPKLGSNYPGLKIKTQYGFDDNLKNLEVNYGKKFSETCDLYIYLGLAKSSGYKVDRDSDSYKKNWTIKWDGEIDNFSFGKINPLNYKYLSNFRMKNFELMVMFEEISHNPQYTAEWAQWFHIVPGELYNYVFNRYNGNLVIRAKNKLYLTINDLIEITLTSSLFEEGYRNESTRKMKSLHHSAEAAYTFKTLYKTTKFDNQKLAIGALFRQRDFYSQKSWFGFDFYDYPSLFDNFEGHFFKLHEKSIFAEDIYFINDKLSILAGLRYDRTDYKKDSIYTFYNYIYNLTDDYLDSFTTRIATSYEYNKNTIFKFSFQQGFRTPDISMFNDIFSVEDYRTGTYYQANENLKEETLDSFEFNTHLEFPSINLKLDLNHFYNIHRDTLSWIWNDAYGTYEAGIITDVLPGYGYVNTDDFHIYGLEYILNFNIMQKTLINLSWSYNRHTNVSGDSSEFNVLLWNDSETQSRRYHKNIVKTSVSHRINDDIFINLSLAYWQGLDFNENPENVHDDRYDLNFMIKYIINDFMDIKLYALDILEDDTARPVVVSSWNNQSPAWGKRLFYLVFNYKN